MLKKPPLAVVVAVAFSPLTSKKAGLDKLPLRSLAIGFERFQERSVQLVFADLNSAVGMPLASAGLVENKGETGFYEVKAAGLRRLFAFVTRLEIIAEHR